MFSRVTGRCLGGCRKIFGVPLAAAVPASPSQAAARREAAAKIAANRTAVVDDLLRNSGIVRGRSNQYGNTLRAVNGYPMEPSPAAVAAVEYALRRLCSWLLHGAPHAPADIVISKAGHYLPAL